MDGVAVSEQTYRQTERVFDYEALEPVAVKGKAEPLADLPAAAGTCPFRHGRDPHAYDAAGGRELEKPLLIGTFERAAQQRSCQLVTVLGEPGVGKSRLCAELFAYIEERPGLVRWRQGRCLPYGEGIAYLGVGGDREGGVRDPRVRLARAGGGEARARAAGGPIPDLPWL